MPFYFHKSQITQKGKGSEVPQTLALTDISANNYSAEIISFLL